MIWLVAKVNVVRQLPEPRPVKGSFAENMVTNLVALYWEVSPQEGVLSD